MACIHFVLGGSNSGKSKFAENRSLELSSSSGDLFFVATGVGFEEEMKKKIELHKTNRSSKFLSIDAPDLDTQIFFLTKPNDVILVDCMSVFVSNVLCMDSLDETLIDKFKRTLEACKCNVVVVGQETSLGVLPDNRLSRQFLKMSGNLNQFVAGLASEVSFVTAGIAQKIKG
jgi:adenosylcobinamide kinase/adenosylcobinamide-phosphate guanylyltransferase